MASIVERGKSYSVVYMTTIHGQRKQKWETYHTKAEAERRKQILDLCQQTKRRKEHEKVETISDLMERYVALYGQTKWSLSTYQSNCGLIRNYVIPLLGNVRLEELSPRVVAELYRDFLQQPRYDGPYHKSCGRTVSLSVLRDIHKLLHSAFEQAVLWEYISRNPFHRAALPRMEIKPRQFLRTDQISVLLEQCDNPRLALALHLAFAGFLRRGEILALTWQDVDWKRSAIRINKTLCRVSQEALRTLGEQNILFEFPPVLKSDKTVLVLKPPKTVSSNRIIYLPEAVMRLLKEHLNHQQEEGTADPIMVFQDKDGHPLQDTTLIKYFQSALQCASLPKVCFHSLRHSSITYKLVLSRGDIKSVQGDSGHAQAEMVTEIYSHVLDENRRKNMLLFEQEFYQNYGTV